MRSEWATTGTNSNNHPRPRHRPGWQGLAALAVILGVALALWLEIMPRLVNPIHPAATDNRLASELANLKLLGLALRLHADEHDGKFPPAISEINWRQTQPGLQRDGLPAAASRFHNPETGRASEWLYYPDRPETDPPETILAASPVAVGPQKDKRLVVRASGVAEILPETDFQRETAAPTPPATP